MTEKEVYLKFHSDFNKPTDKIIVVQLKFAKLHKFLKILYESIIVYRH